MIRPDDPTGLRAEIRVRTPCSDSYVRTDVRTEKELVVEVSYQVQVTYLAREIGIGS